MARECSARTGARNSRPRQRHARATTPLRAIAEGHHAVAKPMVWAGLGQRRARRSGYEPAGRTKAGGYSAAIMVCGGSSAIMPSACM